MQAYRLITLVLLTFGVLANAGQNTPINWSTVVLSGSSSKSEPVQVRLEVSGNTGAMRILSGSIRRGDTELILPAVLFVGISNVDMSSVDVYENGTLVFRFGKVDFDNMGASEAVFALSATKFMYRTLMVPLDTKGAYDVFCDTLKDDDSLGSCDTSSPTRQWEERNRVIAK